VDQEPLAAHLYRLAGEPSGRQRPEGGHYVLHAKAEAGGVLDLEEPVRAQIDLTTLG
jgi:hypothetical protein